MKIKTTKTVQIEEEYELNLGDSVEFKLQLNQYTHMNYSRGTVEYLSKSGKMFIVDDGGNCTLYNVDSIFKINGKLIKEDFSNMKGWRFKKI